VFTNSFDAKHVFKVAPSLSVSDTNHSVAAHYLKSAFPQAKVAMGERVKLVQQVFKGIFHYNDQEFRPDGHQFDHLFHDKETFNIGTLKAEVLFTPGHTPACVSYHIGNTVFTGDTVFMPSLGTARCDFPNGSAEELYESARRIYSVCAISRPFLLISHL
jgi:glyoxylase-like metal-dependent hydrolase (beta-lactamase superfamily II)